MTPKIMGGHIYRVFTNMDDLGFKHSAPHY